MTSVAEGRRMGNYYAHSGRLPDLSDWQPLHEHLTQVATLARELAQLARPLESNLAEAANVAGLLHDLGKYRPEFQRYLRSLPVSREQTYHKQAGAAKAFDSRNWPVAFAIAGHHGGIPDRASLVDLVSGPSGRVVTE